MRIIWFVIAAFLTACSHPSKLGSELPPRAVIGKVFKAFNSCRVDDLVENFSNENLVFFTASTPTPLTSRLELRKYFNFLEVEACSSPTSAKHNDITLTVQALSSAAAVIHAHTTIKYEKEGSAIHFPFYFIFVLQEVSGTWYVISLNAQPVHRE